MKYIYNETGEKLSTKYAGTDEEFYLEFGEDIYISDTYLGEKAIVENGEIRAATRLDLILSGDAELNDGEYIENNELKYVKKPDEFHIWNLETNEWVYRKELEMRALGIEILRLETELSAEYDARDKAVDRGLKALENALSISIEKLTEKLEESYARLKELEDE